jgi:hypothetical protein
MTACTPPSKRRGGAARLSPRRRGTPRGLELYAVAAGELGLVVEDVRGLAHGTIRAINLDDAVPPEAVEAIAALTVSVRALGPYLEGGESGRAREAATRAAGLANAEPGETSNLSAVNIVGQVRMAAVDLPRAAGLERSEALKAVHSATQREIAREQ